MGSRVLELGWGRVLVLGLGRAVGSSLGLGKAGGMAGGMAAGKAAGAAVGSCCRTEVGRAFVAVGHKMQGQHLEPAGAAGAVGAAVLLHSPGTEVGWGTVSCSLGCHRRLLLLRSHRSSCRSSTLSGWALQGATAHSTSSV